jgi:hypothetical protein
MFVHVLFYGLFGRQNNDMCFQGLRWTGTRRMLGRCARILRNWRLLHKPEDAARLEEWASDLERSSRPPRTTWEQTWCRQVASGSLGSDSELEKSEYEPLNKVVGPCNGDLPDDGKNKEPVL